MNVNELMHFLFDDRKLVTENDEDDDQINNKDRVETGRNTNNNVCYVPKVSGNKQRIRR